MSKCTPWFPGNVKPVHVGVYQRQYNQPPTPFYCFWNGRRWMVCADTPKQAAQEDCPSPFSQKPWRGLAKAPK